MWISHKEKYPVCGNCWMCLFKWNIKTNCMFLWRWGPYLQTCLSKLNMGKLTPWLLIFKSKDEPTVLSFWCFFLFPSEGGFILSMKYCCNVFCLLSCEFLCKTASKQKKVHQKIFTRTNYMQISPWVVPWHIHICQHSTQGGGNIMTYAYMSTERSRG